MEHEIITVEPAKSLTRRPLGPMPFGVPRRFGVGTIMVVTAAFAGLLALLRWLGTSPMQVGFWVVFISLVGLGQAVLYRGRKPRQASVVSGAVCFPVLIVVSIVRDQVQRQGYNAFGGAGFCTVIGSLLLGALCGYLAGGIAAGVFLVMDAVEKFLAKLFPRGPTESGDDAAGATEPTPVKNAWRFGGHITWRPVARQWVERRFGPAIPELFSKSIVEHLGAGGAIEQIREVYPEWSSHWFRYDVRLRLATRLLYVEMVLRDDEPNDLSVHVRSVHDERA